MVEGKQRPKFDDYGYTQWHWLARHHENLSLGDNVEIGSFTLLGCEHGIVIEDNVKIGYHCTIMSDSTIDGRRGKVVLKKGCKIGASSVVFPNVTVGEGAVVGAGSIVRHDIPAWECWVGNPARRLKTLASTEEHINYLRESFWNPYVEAENQVEK